MKFWEAMKAVYEGKRVRILGESWYVKNNDDGFPNVFWENKSSKSFYTLPYCFSESWEIVEDPPLPCPWCGKVPFVRPLSPHDEMMMVECRSKECLLEEYVWPLEQWNKRAPR